MRTLLAVPVLVVCLAVPGLWAQSPGAADAGAATGTAAPAAASGAGSADQGAASDENDFFGSAAVEAPQGAAEKTGVAESVENEHVGLSGQLQATSTYSVGRTYLQGSGNLADNSFANVVGGDFLVDMRLQKGFKAFLDLNIGYVPGGTPTTHDFIVSSPISLAGPIVASENVATALLVKEVFIDFNVANTVYFRAGKQVLKWGTGYFWNPSDLINIEHRSFTNLNALLDGVFGLRTDVVFAPWWHLYTFTNLNEVTGSNVWDTAFAARSEFLAGSTEFAVSSWLKSGKVPVFGGDVSTPLPLDWWAKDGKTLNLTAEGTISYGDIQDKFDPVTGPYAVTNRFVPKLDVGLSRSFDVLNVSDRLMVQVEFFYNGDGYDQDMFGLLASNPMKLAAFTSGFFQSGCYGQYYAAAFVTVSDFGTTNMTLSLSGIANLSDSSGTALAGFSWSPVNNFTLALQLGSYLGPVEREYTFSGSSLLAILTATVNF